MLSGAQRNFRGLMSSSDVYTCARWNGEMNKASRTFPAALPKGVDSKAIKMIIGTLLLSLRKLQLHGESRPVCGSPNCALIASNGKFTYAHSQNVVEKVTRDCKNKVCTHTSVSR